MASYPAADPNPGPLLSQAPPDVAADMTDPFGVAGAQERRTVERGGVAPQAYPSDEQGYGVADSSGAAPGNDTYDPAGVTYGQANDTYGQPGAAGGDTYVQAGPAGEDNYSPADPGYAPPPPAPDVSIAAVPPHQDWAVPPRKKRGFLSWFFKPEPPAEIPLSYAPQQ
jgi:hypothetical protein